MAASLITEKLILGRQHSTLKHLAVTLITLGIMMYTYASSKQVPENISIFDWIAGVYVKLTSVTLKRIPTSICDCAFIIQNLAYAYFILQIYHAKSFKMRHITFL